MSLADRDSGSVRRNQCAGDAQLFLVAQQAFWIEGLERETEYSCHRAQRDVTLVPVQTQAQHLLTFVLSHTNHAVIGYSAGIGTGKWAG